MAMGAMVFALIAWRGDMVRAMPQTDAFYKMIGLGVNLRGIAFDDLKISTETVNNKPVLLIEGSLVDVARKSVDIPRLRFIVRDAKGADIYAWNAVLEQPIINPGEKAWFKTRLASPPAEGREIAVRFFHKSDVASDRKSTRLNLIADDEESMRLLVARAISMDGHEIVTAEDGAEALDILTREEGTFDLLLTDIKMPVMDGIALALAAARDFPQVIILLMTGYADQRERASGLEAIVHDVVTKPFAVADIRTAVADALASRKVAD